MLLVNDDVSSRVADMAQRIGNWLVSLDMCHGETIACWPWFGRATRDTAERCKGNGNGLIVAGRRFVRFWVADRFAAGPQHNILSMGAKWITS